MGVVGKALTILFIVMMAFVSIPLIYADDSPVEPVMSKEAQEELSKKAQNALRTAERRLNLQTEIPKDKKDDIFAENLPCIQPSPLNISANVARYFLWGAVIVVVVVIILTIRDNLWSNSRSRRLKHEEEIPDELAPTATAARMDKAKLEADELASQGLYAEAMHVLLLRSVNELRRRLDVSIAVSLTSREILHRIGLSPEGRKMFADIIGRVEISYFGDHQPGQEEYMACRQSFYSLTNALRQGPHS